MSKYIGDVSAYAYAVSKGYTGTEEEFAELMADYADVGQRAEDAAESALNSKTAAQTAAQTATAKASEASTSATSASGSASAASASASQASGSATQAAASATSASGSATAAAGSATTASTKASEASASATAAQTAQTAAEAAQSAAETAQGKAEDAQEAAEDAAESISASATQIATNTANITQLKSEVSALPTDGVVSNSKQLLSENGTDNTEPYTFRAVPVNADRAELDAVVGGTVAWNQLVKEINSQNWSAESGVTATFNDNKIVFTSPSSNYGVRTSAGEAFSPSHVYLATALAKAASAGSISFLFGSSAEVTSVVSVDATEKQIGSIAKTSSNTSGRGFYITALTTSVNVEITVKNIVVFDLTQMFGSTIADYIYSLEQSTAGAGVAFFRKLFPKDYYPYDAGTLKSVEGVSAKVTKDADNNVLGTYPLDSDVTLRGIPKLADGKLSYDGDRYLPDGTVERKYGVVDLGTLNWTYESNYTRFRADYVGYKRPVNNDTVGVILCAKYQPVGSSYTAEASYDKVIGVNATSDRIVVRDTSYSSDAAAFKTAMSGVYLVYELATPTTETADPYQSLQVCDPNGTEEFVTTGIVPVGHETRYPENLRAKIEGLPWDFSSIIAPTEKTTTASRNYTTGSLLIMNNVLYKVTANIANSGTITPGTNVTATTLSEVISALQ